MTEITVVGGGLGGLVAAISVAERGGRVRLHETRRELGGRALTDAGPYRVNLGPHALYRGPFEAWLRERKLLPGLTTPSRTGFRLAVGDRLRRIPLPLLPVLRDRRADAPVDRDYRGWARERLGERAAEAAIGFASLPTFHGDPGALSAAFVQERIRRSLASRPVFYVLGGWGALVRSLARRAQELGVAIETDARLGALPDAPAIVATDLPAAARLLGEPLAWPGPRTALVDVALRARRRDPTAVLDLDRRVYVSRYSAGDPGLAPAGESLLQAAAGLREGEELAAAVARIECVLDLGFRDWRERVTWTRRGLSDGGAGASDPPGASWRDRPAIDRGNGRWLVGDRVAAPGLLSEVAFESARIAARAAAEKAGVRAPR